MIRLKKLLAIGLSMGMLTNILSVVQAESEEIPQEKQITNYQYTKEDIQASREILAAYLDADISNDIDTIIASAVNERYDTIESYKAAIEDETEFAKQYPAFELMEYDILRCEVLDHDNMKYLINLTYQDGFVIEGYKYTKKIDGSWKVYIYDDFDKLLFDVIDVPEANKEAFLESKKSKVQEGKLAIQPFGYYQTLFSNWSYYNMASRPGNQFCNSTVAPLSGSCDTVKLNVRQWSNDTIFPLNIRYEILDISGDNIWFGGNVNCSNNSSTVSYSITLKPTRGQYYNGKVYISNEGSFVSNTYGEAYAIKN